MSAYSFAITLCLILAAGASSASNDLRLIPYPKTVTMLTGRYLPAKGLIVHVSDTRAAQQAADDLKADLLRVLKIRCQIKALPQTKADRFVFYTGTANDTVGLPVQLEGYALVVSTKGLQVQSQSSAGLINGIQTLRQLVIANADADGLPCLSIRDYPSLNYRGFQDDITRGRNSLLKTMQEQVRTARYLRMNFFTYYLEHQFSFSKHPLIGPKEGSLTPEELTKLVDYSRDYEVDVVGCQQSLGHFYNILKHPEYSNLREGNDCLDPTNEGTYRLLDDMYSEQIPLLDAELFNIDCDETYELGTGPSKTLADKIGVGGVYTAHINRVHKLITGKYGKRMMMWGDIILGHPENLNDIPKDVVMLSWGYHAADSFDSAVTPFKNSGYDFFVCPGVNSWSRILPDFNTANINIRNYVRSGLKFGAMGMLNTSWGDDNENLMNYNWHGIAWGAECAWTGSKTSIEDFNRRIGAVLFGEKGEEFGKAITLLSKTHAISGLLGLNDSRFWQEDFGSTFSGRASALNQSKNLLKLVNPALEHLKRAKKTATINQEQLDYFIFGAERMKLIGERIQAYIDAADLYNNAYRLQANKRKASDDIVKAKSLISKITDRHIAAKATYTILWNREAKPYSLNVVLGRYDTLIAKYQLLLDKLTSAQQQLASSKELPSGEGIGLYIAETGQRRSEIDRQVGSNLLPETPWHVREYSKRAGLEIDTGEFDRIDQPIELDISQLSATGDSVRLIKIDSDNTSSSVPAQIIQEGKKKKLAFMISGLQPKDSKLQYMLYYSPKFAAPKSEVSIVRVSDAPNGGKWIESEKLRLLVGREGGNVYRWEVKSMDNLDLTYPGETDWSGFADLGGTNRNDTNIITVLASGPVCARLLLKGSLGVTKTVTLWQGVEWSEINLESTTSWFSNYDNSTLMGAASSTPGSYILSNGQKGLLKPISNSLSSAAMADGLHWAAKYLAGGAMIAMLTPEVATTLIVGPGDGMGAVSINSGKEASHFIIFGGKSPEEPESYLGMLRATTDYRAYPKSTLYKPESRADSAYGVSL